MTLGRCMNIMEDHRTFGAVSQSDGAATNFEEVIFTNEINATFGQHKESLSPA